MKRAVASVFNCGCPYVEKMVKPIPIPVLQNVPRSILNKDLALGKI
jgi:hypothetical protein